MVSLTNFRTVSELDEHLTGKAEVELGRKSSMGVMQMSTTDSQSVAQQIGQINNNNNNNNNITIDQHNFDNNKFLNFAAKQATPPILISSTDPSRPSDHLKDVGHNQREHFEIRWTNLVYEVETKWYQRRPGADRGKKNILNGLNGSVKSGQVTAILGPSGAGKTSLLGCLTGKNKSGVSGCIQVFSDRSEPLSICTIPQKDYLLNQLTVRENLWFASRLKHPEKGFDHDSNIDRVLELLKLESCIDTKISKISGGQYKRVSIAQELLSNPDILILDEPTSGLDSLTCYKTVMVLRDLARLSPNPMAIIVTIHQPQREVFELFNHVYILAVGGRAIYEGEPSQSIETINETSGLHFDANQYNPASYLVEIASVEFGEKPIEALVEHQRRQFFGRQSVEWAASGNHAHPRAAHMSRSPAATPGLKKRQSPMVARFKSTLSSLGGGGGGGGGNSETLPMRNSGYTNEAFIESQTGSGQQHLNIATYLQLDAGLAGQQRRLGNRDQIRNDDDLMTNISNNNNNKQLLQITTSDGQPLEEGQFYLDERLQTHKHNHKGHFLRHCRLLTRRSWLCLCKDPMLTTLRFSAHIIVPLLITLVYGSRVGRPNACPLYESDMDLIDYARRGAKRLLNLQDELRCSFENVGLYFLSIYAFTFSTMCLTSLSFPLNMHVLLKEVRNGWYSIPTYFIGKTLADFPLEFILPTLTLCITYPLTGQPSSYMEWRFVLATAIFVITSLIAQTQGLIFGALFMNAMQAAVFVAPVSTTPLILLSGFLIRISQMPSYLQTLSCFSYFRYAIESLAIIRYGFGQCPCDPSVVTGKPVSATGVPDQVRTMTNYWLATFESEDSANALSEAGFNATGSLASITTTTLAPEQPIDFFQDLTVLLARANSFGADIKTCQDLKPYPMIDFSLKDEQLYVWVSALVATLFVSKIINYLVVKYSVKFRL